MVQIENSILQEVSESEIRNGSFTVPASIHEIGTGAFHSNRVLETISIPTTVTSIGKVAFYGCTRLKRITIPQGISEIRSLTFAGCVNMEEISLPASISEISGDAFRSCPRLTKIIIDARSSEDFERIKKLLPIELQDKAVTQLSVQIKENQRKILGAISLLKRRNTKSTDLEFLSSLESKVSEVDLENISYEGLQERISYFDNQAKQLSDKSSEFNELAGMLMVFSGLLALAATAIFTPIIAIPVAAVGLVASGYSLFQSNKFQKAADAVLELNAAVSQRFF